MAWLRVRDGLGALLLGFGGVSGGWALSALSSVWPWPLQALVLTLLGGLLTGIGRWQRERCELPVSAAVTVLSALRQGDYSHRARGERAAGAAAAVLVEVNALAAHLERERQSREEARALLGALIERVDVAVLAFDDGDRIMWWNAAARALVRTPLREGALASDLGLGALLAGPTERAVELEGHPLGSAFELRRGVFYQAGQRRQFVLLASALRLRREEERLAWQRLVRVMGHEVNNTLAPIQSLAQTCAGIVAKHPETPSVVTTALQTIEQRARRLSAFIADYAKLARLPEPRRERVSLATELTRLASLDTRCPLRLVGRGPGEVDADPVLLDQALSNLLRNAIDASSETEGSVTVDWWVSGADLVLTITDEGRGIANPDNLFVPLFSTKSGGSGIGLVLARNIIEAHGGQLTLASRTGGTGAQARVVLPSGGSRA